VQGRSFFEAQRASTQDSTRASDRIALASAFVGGVLVAVILIVQANSQTPTTARLFGAAATPAPHVQPGHQAEPQDATADSGIKTSAVVQPTAVPTEDLPGTRRQVVGTDGQGVVLRASPREDDRTPRGFMDGDWVTLEDRSGPDWALVRGDNGQEGWVPARYLTL
jgi:hypothetical protein